MKVERRDGCWSECPQCGCIYQHRVYGSETYVLLGPCQACGYANLLLVPAGRTRKV